MKLYTIEACEKLIHHYIEHNGEIKTLEEGCLGLGKLLLTAPSLKTIVIQEVYINEWSSGHKVRIYKKTPKKYL
jgi:hypothetical protein